MPPKLRAFFVYCRELGRGEEKFRLGTAMMTDVGGNRTEDTLYIMIPVDSEQAKRIERVYLVVRSRVGEQVIGYEVDRISQEKIDREK